MSKITLSMIVKNEEEHLRACLESAIDVVNEIIIVDTGSTDSTVKIAEEFDVKVYHFEWINDFSAARNFALSKSTGDWILYLDADERLNNNSKEELINRTKENNKLGINCIINNLDDFNNSPKLMKYVRLFKNDKNVKFSGQAHEQIEPSLIDNNYKLIESSIEIIHHGYNVNSELLKNKARRNLELMLMEYKISSSSYLSFQIANSYSILEDLENTIKYYKEALEDKNLRREFKSVCYLHLTDYEMRANNFIDAKKFVDNGLKADKNHTLLNMIASQVYEKINQKDSSIFYCKKAFDLNNKNRSDISKNVIDIIIDNKKIIIEGLLTSIKFNAANDIKYFLNLLKLEDPAYHNNINYILTNQLDNEAKVDELIFSVSEKNLEVLLKFLKYNSNNEFKLDFFSRIYDKFNNHSNYLTNFGAFLISIDQLDEAKIILESSLQNEHFDDAVIFYLASIYTSTNKIQELQNLLTMADIKAESNQLLQSKLNLLKEKLYPILQNL